jgi:hypothetical protein
MRLSHLVTLFNTPWLTLLREGYQRARVEYDQHIHGLFLREDWLELLRDAGFEPKIIRDPYARDVFVARKSKG